LEALQQPVKREERENSMIIIKRLTMDDELCGEKAKQKEKHNVIII
jgi:hypothetical protein